MWPTSTPPARTGCCTDPRSTQRCSARSMLAATPCRCAEGARVLVGLGIALTFVVLVAAFAFWLRGAQATPEELARIDASLDAFLEKNRDAIAATLRPVVRIALEPMAQDDVRASKVGGAAWWPADEARPL